MFLREKLVNNTLIAHAPSHFAWDLATGSANSKQTTIALSSALRSYRQIALSLFFLKA